MTCTFFGHRDCPEMRPYLRTVLADLISNHQVDTFLVGNNGQFDGQVRAVLRQLSQEYPQIRYAVVLSRVPGQKAAGEDYKDTMLPEGLEEIHPKFAIDWRNRWMLGQADYVVTYIRHNWGGAWKYASLARKQNKYIYNMEL